MVWQKEQDKTSRYWLRLILWIVVVRRPDGDDEINWRLVPKRKDRMKRKIPLLLNWPVLQSPSLGLSLTSACKNDLTKRRVWEQGKGDPLLLPLPRNIFESRLLGSDSPGVLANHATQLQSSNLVLHHLTQPLDEVVQRKVDSRSNMLGLLGLLAFWPARTTSSRKLSLRSPRKKSWNHVQCGSAPTKVPPQSAWRAGGRSSSSRKSRVVVLVR